MKCVLIPVAIVLLLAAPAIPQQAAKPPIAKLVSAQGKVELKRDGQLNYRAAVVNESLYYGDLLRVQRNSRGVIRCTSDSTTWTIPADGVPRGVANTCSPPVDR